MTQRECRLALAAPRLLRLAQLCLGLRCLLCCGLRFHPKQLPDAVALSPGGVEPVSNEGRRDIAWGVQHPVGPAVRPIGRHIQYRMLDYPHGMSDRVRYNFLPLVALGKFFNATVHIHGGASAPRLWLHSKHTFEVGESWGRYFDLAANGGNPWHELESFEGCRTFKRPIPPEDWVRTFTRLFESVSCINIDFGVKGWIPRRLVADMQPEMQVSKFVTASAQDFLKRYNVDPAFGSCHIRRCDRLVQTKNRTDLSNIRQQLRRKPDISTWVFFVYAEEGYAKRLKKALQPLGKKLLFEDEVVLNSAFPRDNYFSYVLGKYLNSQAKFVVETDSYGPQPVGRTHEDLLRDGVYLTRSEGSADRNSVQGDYPMEEAAFLRGELFTVADAEYEAICNDNARGANLLPSAPEPS